MSPSPDIWATGSTRRETTVLLPVVTFALTTCVLAIFWWDAHSEWQSRLQTLQQRAANQAAAHLTDHVTARLLAVGALSDAQATLGSPTTGGIDSEAARSFVLRAEVTQHQFGSFQAINWIEPDGTISIVVPLASNRPARGRNVGEHPEAGPTFQAAAAAKELRMTGPLTLFQGGRGFAVYQPVVRAGELLGFVNAVFRTSPLVRAALHAQVLEPYDVRIEDGDTLVYESEGFDSDDSTSSSELTVAGRQWHVTLHPSPEHVALQTGQRRALPYALALVLAAIACFFMYRGLVQNQRRHAEAERRRLLEVELERTARMEALGRLAAGVAHDFGNIITAVSGNADLIRMATSQPDVNEYADEIIAASERATDLTARLSGLGTQFVDDAQALDVGSQLADLSQLLRRVVQPGIRLTVSLPGEPLWPIRAAEADLSQVVINLTVNAANAMPDGGDVTLTAKNVPAGDLVDDHRTSRDGVIITVEDHGVGMDEATRSRIFEPYFTTRSDAGGTGLGLANVRAVVDRTGGVIEVTSEIGRGSRFAVWFPADDRDQPNGAEPHPDSAVARTS